MTVKRQPALLLLGPTGSGKTPLGQLIEVRGLPGKQCVHFDFGENLRELVARNQPDDAISREDIEFLRGVLASGALLEDEQFPLAKRILQSFLARRCADGNTWVVLNGLPRHVGQAQAIDAMLSIRVVVSLECSDDAVLGRLASNVGGDRGGRPDDGFDEVRKKLEIFSRRTAPLVEHYRRQGVRSERVEMTPATTAEDAWAGLSVVLNRSRQSHDLDADAL